jgi:hypothetical protein
MPKEILKELTEDAAVDWLIGQTILGVEGDTDNLTLVFKTGYIEVSGDDFEIYVETGNEVSH